MSYILNLPNEITVEILGYIKTGDIFSVSLANRKFYKLLQDDYTWQLMCRNRYPQNRILEAQNDLSKDGALKQAFITNRDNEQGENADSLENLGSSTNVPPATAATATAEHNELEWPTLYKYLSNPISYVAKERGVVWLNDLYWRTEAGESDYGKIVHLDHVWWFDVCARLKCVQPGSYDIIWRLKVDDEHNGLGCLNFTTQVLPSGYVTLDIPETIIQERNYVPSSELFKNILSRGTWVEYCLPYQIVIPEERIIDGEYIWYDVMCKIYNHDNSYKYGLSIDYVKLRHRQDGREYEVLEHVNYSEEG